MSIPEFHPHFLGLVTYNRAASSITIGTLWRTTAHC